MNVVSSINNAAATSKTTAITSTTTNLCPVLFFVFVFPTKGVTYTESMSTIRKSGKQFSAQFFYNLFQK